MARRIGPLTQPTTDITRRTGLWWDEHPMDYLGHQGRPVLSDDETARRFFARIDRAFRRAAWFAQADGAPLFSGFIDYDALRGRRVLEIGCGLGAISAELARRGAQLTALDLTWTGVTSVTRRFCLDRTHAGAARGDAVHLPFVDASFDFVWCWGVLPYVADLGSALGEIQRVLRPGGEVRLMVYNRRSIYNWLGIMVRYGVLRGELRRRSVEELWSRYSDGREIGGSPFVRYDSAGDLRQLMAGFDVLEMRTFEQKAILTWCLPRGWRGAVEALIPDRMMRLLFGRFGMLLYCRARKWGLRSLIQESVPIK